MNREILKEIERATISGLDLSQNLSSEEILERIDVSLSELSKKQPLSIESRESLRKTVFRKIRGLGILQELIEDPTITEIMVNGTEGIFIERKGKLSILSDCFGTKEELRQIIWQITADCNRVVNDSNPIVDARLADGARVNVVLDPVAVNGPILTIRRFPPKPITMEDYLQMGTLSLECSSFLEEAVRNGRNICILGGTGSGKTTFLNVLTGYIPKDQRVITIEDSAELQIQGIKNLVRLETRNANVEGCKEITIRDLLKASLRMRPDRIIVGEVRSKEAIDMLQSVNVGHSAMTTVHANSVRDVISRLETMVLTGMEIPVRAIRGQIASGFDLFIHLGRCGDGSRRVFEIAEPLGIRENEVEMHSLFKLEDGVLLKVSETKNEKKIF